MDKLEEKKIQITLSRDEILRHVQDTAWLLAKSAASKSDQPDREDSYLMDVFKKTFEGDGNDEIATRYLTNSFNYCVTFFRQYLNDYITADLASAVSDTLTKPTSYSIVAYVADSHTSDVRYLTEQLHNLIAADVLYNWCIIVAPEYVERMNLMKTEAENRLKEQQFIFNNRRRPAKRS